MEITERRKSYVTKVRFPNGDEHRRVELPEGDVLWTTQMGDPAGPEETEALEMLFQEYLGEKDEEHEGWGEVKPCPFCGSDDVKKAVHEGATTAGGYNYFDVLCCQCGASVTATTRREATEKWNWRPGENPYEYLHNSLFEDRTPQAAATQMERVLAWIAECELATLSRYERLKSASKSQTERHQNICNRLIRHCHELNVSPEGFNGDCPLLRERLESFEQTDETDGKDS